MKGSMDRYVGRIVAGSWLATMLFFLLLTVLLDLLNNLGKYLDRGEANGLGLWGMASFLGRYYLQLTPVTFLTVAPFVTVIACMFALARLQAANELVPMLFTGRSMFRILRPMLYTGALVALGMAGCWQWVVPTLRTELAESNVMLGGAGSESKGVVLSEESEGRRKMLYVAEYDHATHHMQELTLLLEGTVPGDVAVLQAKSATWDKDAGDWRLVGGEIRRGNTTELERPFLGEPQFTPDRVWKAGMENLDAESLSYTDLREMHQLRPNRLDVTLALHRHITYPLANLVMLLLALPFAIHFERGSRVERTIGAIGVCGAYLLVDLICQSLGQRDWLLQPVAAAWLPTILFGSLGVTMYGGIKT